MKLKKRFIAGATCPNCEAVDTIMLYKENNIEKVECVKCGHTMIQPEDSVNAATRQFEQVIGVFKPE
ncbi:MAG: YheV family putative metal-binding protein [Psychrosphaera sp.]|nr:YheV family putative metal-binding protein [Psychrosphaera sp.]